jgi:hypothetical protein
MTGCPGGRARLTKLVNPTKSLELCVAIIEAAKTYFAVAPAIKTDRTVATAIVFI